MTIKKTQKLFLNLFFSFTFLLLFNLFSPLEAHAGTVKGFYFQPGDIVITSTTAYAGITGHAGIVLPDGYTICHTAGKGALPSKINISDWLVKYSDTKVVRMTDFSNHNSFTPKGASYYALNYFINGSGSNTTYAIYPDLRSQNYVYCSKLVWQCYDNVGLQFEVLANDTSTSDAYFEVPLMIHPYSFLNAPALKHNGFSVVKSF